MPWFRNYYTSRFLICTGRRIVHESGISIDDTVSEVIQSGEWIWPGARTAEMVEVQSAICALFSLKLNRKILLGSSLLKAFSHNWQLSQDSVFDMFGLQGEFSSRFCILHWALPFSFSPMDGAFILKKRTENKRDSSSLRRVTFMVHF